MENISGEETARLLRRFGTVRTVPKGTLLSGKEAYWLLGGICALTCVNESGSHIPFSTSTGICFSDSSPCSAAITA